MITVAIYLTLSALVGPLLGHVDQEVPCGIPGIAYLVRNGEIADEQKHPWHAVLFHLINSTWEFECGGTLINSLFVLTARHCTKVPLNRQLVKLGLHRLDNDNSHSQSYSISAIETAKQGGFLNDIALIELNATVKFTEFILPACLAGNVVAEHETGTVVGFGRTENETYSQELKMLSVPVVNSNMCLRNHREFGKKLDEKLFCAGHRDGRAVCDGDSGGGLLFERNGTMMLGGIVSFTALRGKNDSHCKEDGYAIYTNVSSYQPWIEQKIQGVMDKLRNQHCGLLDSNASMILWIYEQQYNDLIGVGVVISRRYVLSIGDPIFESFNFNVKYPNDLRKLADVEIVDILSTAQERLTLLRLDRDLVFGDRVQPICLPTSEELRSDAISNHLIGYDCYDISPNFTEITSSNLRPAQCVTECSKYRKIENFSPNDTNWLCLENKAEYPFIGFYSSQKGLKQFVLLGGVVQFCSREEAIFFKLNYEDHVQWINRIIKL